MSTKEKTDETDEATAGGGRKKLLLLVLVILLAAGGAAYFFLFSGSGEAEAAAPEHGGYVALEPIAVNLAGGGYLKVGVTLEITAEAAGGGHGGDGVDGSKALDLVISTFSQAAPADVVGAREALKQALKAKIIEAYTDHEVPMVMDIYYNEYVTQ
ncbi:flagellar basal body protein FliL [Blastococcus sp. CT_GayMR20]|uniref:flagellar basal body-associated FliL family protein n=1 Tax=Blastococcus sp. CT_GayMR20 TaxID=2559609 RepID=UPI0010735FC8|nr:flagellar basal body-associated FliL family protein [Blastococcus sp. CT_GayMR20]TFV68488.1 flagellar basal body protein FliL [Blastococcus sp. CT_GayMR20]